MHVFGFPPVLQRRFGWLLWLALLLLPIAQTVATRHALSHTLTSSAVLAGVGASVAEVRHPASADSSAKTDGDTVLALHPSACDLCLAGAVLVSGALPTTPFVVAQTGADPVQIAALLTSVWQAGPVRAYRSRAPPTASH